MPLAVSGASGLILVLLFVRTPLRWQPCHQCRAGAPVSAYDPHRQTSIGMRVNPAPAAAPFGPARLFGFSMSAAGARLPRVPVAV